MDDQTKKAPHCTDDLVSVGYSGGQEGPTELRGGASAPVEAYAWDQSRVEAPGGGCDCYLGAKG